MGVKNEILNRTAGVVVGGLMRLGVEKRVIVDVADETYRARLPKPELPAPIYWDPEELKRALKKPKSDSGLGFINNEPNLI